MLRADLTIFGMEQSMAWNSGPGDSVFLLFLCCRDKREQWERIRRSVVGHLRSNPEALVVIEEYDR